jgi:TetR/AcrR family transcriptional regulator, transcriptional repressor for nem operon
VDRRVQIVRAAAAVLYARGYEGTTLALVAEQARLPLGNLYYYFRIKDDLVSAVVDARMAELETLFASAERGGQASPLRRLRRFLAAFEAGAAQIVAHGCPYGSLTQELARRPGALSRKAAGLFALQLAWLSRQFRALGEGARSDDRAADLICAIQGACLLGLALHDPAVFRRRLREISRRLADRDRQYRQ